MGIYIFDWKVLKNALTVMKDVPSCDFGKHIIPYCHEQGERICAYDFKGYWKDVGTLGSYWEANMELVDIIPEFNLYEEFWRIYTKSDALPPQYIADKTKIGECIIGEGTEIYGEVQHSVIGSSVTIEEGAIVKDSIIMNGVVIGKNCVIDKAIIAENTVIGDGAVLGVGEYAPSEYNPKVYAFDLVTIGEKSVIPAGVKIGKNTAIFGETTLEDYPNGELKSGGSLIKVGDLA
jgi:glucose-1-phosphate adenylyltransferase